MKISKYEALGNSFLITEFKKNIDYKAYARKLCDYSYSIGADGLLVLNKNKIALYNKDGSLASFCFNGLRCASLYYALKGIYYNEFYMDDYPYEISYLSLNPFLVKIKNDKLFEMKSINQNDYLIKGSNNHYLSYLKDIDFEAISKKLDLNVSSIKKEKDKLYIKTYERGVGFTNNCGSASFYSALLTYEIYHDFNLYKVYSNNEFIEIDPLNKTLTGSANLISSMIFKENLYE